MFCATSVPQPSVRAWSVRICPIPHVPRYHIGGGFIKFLIWSTVAAQFHRVLDPKHHHARPSILAELSRLTEAQEGAGACSARASTEGHV